MLSRFLRHTCKEVNWNTISTILYSSRYWAVILNTTVSRLIDKHSRHFSSILAWFANALMLWSELKKYLMVFVPRFLNEYVYNLFNNNKQIVALTHSFDICDLCMRICVYVYLFISVDVECNLEV